MVKFFKINVRVLHIVSTGLLPQELHRSKQVHKIMKVDNHFKKSCNDEANIKFVEQDFNWIHKDQSLNTSLYYKDHLHLVQGFFSQGSSATTILNFKLSLINLPGDFGGAVSPTMRVTRGEASRNVFALLLSEQCCRSKNLTIFLLLTF